MEAHNATDALPVVRRAEALAAGVGIMAGQVGEGRETLNEYRATGGYPPLAEPSVIRAAVRAAEVRGAGGAGFPTAVKLDAVAAAPGPRVAVANGEEGEPASAKDRRLLRNRPHLVLDGLRHAAHAVGADTAFVYVSDAEAAASVRQALAELAEDGLEAGATDSAGPDPVGPAGLRLPAFAPTLVEVAPSYVAGEETAVVRALGGDIALPLPKPPRPYQQGVGGRPTLVSNVETLARIALAARSEPGALAGGTVLLTVVAGGDAWVCEADAAAPLAAAVERVRGSVDGVSAVLMGGFAGGIWRPDALGAAASHDALRAHGALLGCGAVVLVEDGDCPVAAAADAASFLAASSAGQCGACVRGTHVSAEQLIAIARGVGTAENLALLRRRTAALPGRGNCALPDALAMLLRTLDEHFAAELDAHLAGPCPVCVARVSEQPTTATRFRVQLPHATA